MMDGVIADNGCFWLLERLRERDWIGGELWEVHFGIKILLLANVDRNKFVGLKLKNQKILRLFVLISPAYVT